MASAAEMYRRLQSVNKITVLREMVYAEISEKEKDLLDIKYDEFEQGDIYGNYTTSRYKNAEYGNMKYQQNPRAGGNVDLIYTGAFLESFKLNKPKQNKYMFGATDKKRNKLVEKYGIDIMGLNQDDFDKFQIEVIRPKFIKKLQSIINKK